MAARQQTKKLLPTAGPAGAGSQSSLGVTVPTELIDALAERVACLLVEQIAGHSAAQPPVSSWLTFDQACAYLGFSRDTLYKLTAAKAIPVRKKQEGQGLRFRREELDDWMDIQYPRVDRLG